MGDDDGEERHRADEDGGDARGDVALTPDDQREGDDVVEDGKHHQVAPLPQAPGRPESQNRQGPHRKMAPPKTLSATMFSGGSPFSARALKKNDPPQMAPRISSSSHWRAPIWRR